jgi:hypothetical protein
MTEARIGWGGELWLATDNTEATLTELAEVREVSFPADEVDEAEATHLKSPGRRKEFVAGLIDGGEMTATFNYAPGSATDLLLTAAKDTGDTRKLKIIIPDNSGTVFVKKYAPDNMTTGDVITASATFRVTGALEQGAGESGS